MHIPHHIKILTVILVCAVPTFVGGTTEHGKNGKPYDQEFIITAYYSPLPEQCCYVRGSEIADKELNGNGAKGADGTEVYPGMIAAPAAYPFGTRIALPGIGVVTVHDRGGAIQVLNSGPYRLDVWVGFGEEGLARALAFGVQHVTGTVYPVGAMQPKEQLSFDNLPSPYTRLKAYDTADAGLLDVHPRVNEAGLSVALLQEHLRDIGFLDHTVTGSYGEETRAALSAFLQSVGISENGNELTRQDATLLIAAVKLQGLSLPFGFIGKESDSANIVSAKRILRFLGFYRGRTTGEYDDKLFGAILQFQQKQKLVGTETDPGAGRIGPLTKEKLLALYRSHQIHQLAQKYLLFAEVRDHLKNATVLPERFLSKGDSGKDVRSLQELLVNAGFFPETKVNGVFGDLTKSALTAYQLQMKVVDTAKSTGAGVLGSVTLRQIRAAEASRLYKLVRAEGLAAL